MVKRGFRAAPLAAVAALSVAAASMPAQAEAKSLTADEFTFPADGTMTIVVFRPDVHVGSLKVGGFDEPNAEWTEQARVNIQQKLEERAASMNAQVHFIDELEGEDAQLLTDYRSLFEVVSGAIFQHVTQRDKLPTKIAEKEQLAAGRKIMVKEQLLDWTLGPGAAQLKQKTGADYAMFVFTHDAYGDGGRKAAQAIGMLGCLIGVCVVMQAGVHVGYAGLVDLETGDIVWFNTDLSMGGDPRELDGADKRVGQLLEGFPSREFAAASEGKTSGGK